MALDSLPNMNICATRGQKEKYRLKRVSSAYKTLLKMKIVTKRKNGYPQAALNVVPYSKPGLSKNNEIGTI